LVLFAVSVVCGCWQRYSALPLLEFALAVRTLACAQLLVKSFPTVFVPRLDTRGQRVLRAQSWQASRHAQSQNRYQLLWSKCLATETTSERYADIDLWTSTQAIAAMVDGQLEAVSAVKASAAELAAAVDAAVVRLRGTIGRLVYVGAGTSGRVAIQDGVELGPTFDWGAERTVYALAGGERALLASVEGAEDDASEGAAAMQRASVCADDVVVGVAASGSTPYTVGALQYARAAGALTVGLACNPATPLLEVAAHPILLATGAEFVAGSTRMKAGTAQKVALNLFSTAVMLQLGRVYRGRMVSMRVSNRKLRTRAIAMVADLASVDLPAAENALERAASNIKLAVLIALGADAAQAEKVLTTNGGNLRRAIAALEMPDRR
jgi:N-acetylmuramic acid 6-phosphate etherase